MIKHVLEEGDFGAITLEMLQQAEAVAVSAGRKLDAGEQLTVEETKEAIQAVLLMTAALINEVDFLRTELNYYKTCYEENHA